MAEHVLRARRLAAGLSQEALAELADVSTTTIRNIEKGRVTEPRLGARIEAVLEQYEAGPSLPLEPSSLTYTTADGTRIQVDSDLWEPSELTPRERAVCRALLQHALHRLDEDPR